MLQTEQVLQGRYQLQRQLGQNPGRQTWLARDVRLSSSELVIVKLLAFSPQMQWDEFKLFERESQVLKQLHHSRIPQYVDYFSIDQENGAGLCWFGLVQQYIPGASIGQLLSHGKRFTETEVQKLATDVLEILTYLHNLNPPVLHRDIKPSNLILGDDEQIYLVDFGAVQDSAATEGITFTVVGTSGYAPLEQFWGRTVPASDLYGLGATLIHLLTGTSPAELPQRDLRIQFCDRISLSANFTRWIEVLTAPDLEQRFNNASEALEALISDHYPKFTISTIPKPIGSRVKLKKSANKLSIKIPQKKNKQSFLYIIKLTGNLLLIIWTIAVMLLIMLIVPYITIIAFINLLAIISSFVNHSLIIGLIISCLFIFMFVGFLFTLLVPLITLIVSGIEICNSYNEICKILSNYFEQDYCLDFNQRSLVIKQKVLGLSYLRKVQKLENIKKIYQVPFEHLKISTKYFSYAFGEELTESERGWLFQEIQDWLNNRL